MLKNKCLLFSIFLTLKLFCTLTRNPFAFQATQTSDKIECFAIGKVENQSKYCALIKFNNNFKIVQLGDKLGKYGIVSINKKGIVISDINQNEKRILIEERNPSTFNKLKG